MSVLAHHGGDGMGSEDLFVAIDSVERRVQLLPFLFVSTPDITLEFRL